jgi:Uncharacterized protein conserved in bacteria (DUF2334)
VPVEYIVRLDDACPTMDGHRWGTVEEVLMRTGVRPIAAVVPANRDPELIRGPADRRFWERARSWADAGWMIAMHGYSHVLTPSRGGLVPVNRRSEFVGLPAEEQRRRVREGMEELQARGLSPEAWVPPAHGLDRCTLEAIRSETRIRIISDSFAIRPVRRWGFVWVPQQLWRPRAMPGGLWTICLHPNGMDSNDAAHLEEFIKGHKDAFPDPHKAAERSVPYGLSDMIWSAAFLSALRVRQRLRQRKV